MQYSHNLHDNCLGPQSLEWPPELIAAESRQLRGEKDGDGREGSAWRLLQWDGTADPAITIANAACPNAQLCTLSGVGEGGAGAALRQPALARPDQAKQPRLEAGALRQPAQDTGASGWRRLLLLLSSVWGSSCW